MSRYPAFGPNQFYPYDRSLLSAAPPVTRQDRQAGYDIGIIERGLIPSASAAPAPAPVPAPVPIREPNPFADTPTDLLNKELPSHPTPFDSSSFVPPSRWYRTKRGIAILILIFLIFLSIIIGVAVGVSEGKRKQEAITAPQSPDDGPDLGPSNTVTLIISSSSSSPFSSPQTVASTPKAATNIPLLTTDPVGSFPTPTNPPAVTLIEPSRTLRATRPPKTAIPTPSTSSGLFNPGQGGTTEPGPPSNEPWYCALLPFICK